VRKPATIVDIAAKLGITPSAVSKALNGHPRISDETRNAVITVARELSYSPNSLASGLRRGKSGLIAILVPGIHYGFFSTAIKGAEEVLSRKGYNVIIAQSKDSADLERRQLDGFRRAKVEGIIASLAMETQDYRPYTSLAVDIPLVLFDRTISDEQISGVMVDDFAGAVKAVDHLVEMGYKRIGHLAGLPHVMPFGRRIDGYKYALAKHGLPFRNEYLRHCAPSKEEGIIATEKLLNLSEPPDAIFAHSDHLAFGAVSAIRNRGLSVPADIGIVGFSNEELSGDVTPSITTVDQFSETMGAAAAEIMIDQLHHRQLGKPYTPQKRLLSPKLIVRQSSLKDK
jgi:LacI family transcriptional regulator